MKRIRQPPAGRQLHGVIQNAAIIGLGGVGQRVALQLAVLSIHWLQ